MRHTGNPTQGHRRGSQADEEATLRPPSRSASRRRRGCLLPLLLLAGLVAAGVVWGPALAVRGVATATVLEGLDLGVPRPLAPEVTRRSTTVGGVEVDRYEPVGGSHRAAQRPAIVLVPGATPQGREDRRVIAIATAIARAQRSVVVPELAVYGEDLLVGDLDRIVAVTAGLADTNDGVVLAGLSFGGSLALIAADDPAVRDQVRLVATFGAYADLAGVVQAAITGVSLVDGQRIPWEADPRAQEVVRGQLLELVDERARSALEAALDRELDPDALPVALRSLHDLLVEGEPDRVMAHLDAAPEVVRERIAAVSPVRAAPDLAVPLVALHAVDDPVIPYGELQRLQATYPQLRALTLRTFDHLGLGDDGHGWWVRVRDLIETARFVTVILEADATPGA